MSFDGARSGRRRGRPLIIEFIGTPGAGKTTLTGEVVELLREHGFDANTVIGAAREHAARTLPGRAVARLVPNPLRRPLLWQVFYVLSMVHAVRFSGGNVSLTRWVLSRQLRRPISAAMKRHVLFWFLQLTGRYRFLTTTSGDHEALVLDDGFLHRSIALNAASVGRPDAQDVAAYVDRLPRPDLVVFTIAGQEVCEQRVRERGVWRHSRHAGDAELSRYLANAGRVADLAVRRARQLGWTVVEIDNGGRELDRVRRHLRDALAPLVAGVDGPDRDRGASARPVRIPHVPRPSRISSYLAARLGPPVIDEARVHAVLDRYGLQIVGASHNLRLGRRSRNVKVATRAGTKVVKLYRPQWKPATVRYGHSILARLEDLDFPAARLARTHDGETWTCVDDGIFAVFDFVPGTNYSLNFLRRGDRLRLTDVVGRTLARLHRCLDGFVPEGHHHLGFASPTGPRRRDLTWYTAKLDELRDRSAELTDRDAILRAEQLIRRSADVLDAMHRLEEALAGADLPRLVIHGDFGLHNLIFQSTGVVVPVDFEVSRLDWRLNDLISALGKYRYNGGVYDQESMKAFLQAYGGEFPLTDDESRLLPEAWRLYRLQAAVQYWNSYFETGGPTRKLESALRAIGQAEWVVEHPEVVRRFGRVAGGRIGPHGRSRVGRPGMATRRSEAR